MHTPDDTTPMTTINVPLQDAAATKEIIDIGRGISRGTISAQEGKRRLDKADPDRRVTNQLIASYGVEDMPGLKPGGSPTERIIALAAAKAMDQELKSGLLSAMDPDHKHARPAIAQLQQRIVELDEDLRGKREESIHAQIEYERARKLKATLDLYEAWEQVDTFRLVLQPNDCSRIHKVREASDAGLFYDIEDEHFHTLSGIIERAKVFVVKHDWAAAFGDSLGEDDPFRLPYDVCAFEFRITGRTLILLARANEALEGIEWSVMFEGAEGVWFTVGGEGQSQIAPFLIRQVRAICVALEAQVAEHSVTRAPHKLNEKRAKAGKPPVRDFHVVDLSRRTRAASAGRGEATGRKVRMHFRRGHWRHYSDHKTWIEWMLVGNPDLGFIDKQYRI